MESECENIVYHSHTHTHTHTHTHNTHTAGKGVKYGTGRLDVVHEHDDSQCR